MSDRGLEDDAEDFVISLMEPVANKLRTLVTLGLLKGEVTYGDITFVRGETKIVTLTYDDLVSLGMPKGRLPKVTFDTSRNVLIYDLE